MGNKEVAFHTPTFQPKPPERAAEFSLPSGYSEMPG
jgi:hypothetical protein